MIYTNSRYYEGILQIRPNDEKVLKFVYDEIERAENVMISKEVVKKFGTDLYLTNKFFISLLSAKLRKKFNGIVTRSSALYKTSRLTSKQVTRLTICFRLTKDL